MIRSRRLQDDDGLNPDLTALMDIIFIVMVFLLLSANIQIQTLDVTLPTTEQSQALTPQSEAVVLAISVINDEETWGLQDQQFNDWQQFSEAFLDALARDPSASVIIACDKQTNVGKLLKLVEFMQVNNIQATNIMMEGA